jgi:hypothetical protein
MAGGLVGRGCRDSRDIIGQMMTLSNSSLRGNHVPVQTVHAVNTAYVRREDSSSRSFIQSRQSGARPDAEGAPTEHVSVYSRV